MRGLVFLLTILLIVVIVLPVNSVPSGQGQQLFFDNFSTSQFSPNWQINTIPTGISGCSIACNGGNLTQTGGWLGLTVPRSLINPSPGCGGPCFGFNSIMATNVNPIITSQKTTSAAITPSFDGATQAQFYSNFNVGQLLVFQNTVSGDTYILYVVLSVTTGSIPTVSSVIGTNDNGWLQRGSSSVVVTGSQVASVAEFYAVITSTSDSVTVTLNSSCNTNSCSMELSSFGVKNFVSFDSGTSQTGTGTGTSSSVSISTNVATPVIVFGATATTMLNCGTITAGSGYTQIYNCIAQTASQFADEYKIQTPNGGPSPLTFSYSSSNSWASIADAIDGKGSGVSYTNSGTGFFYMVWRIVPFNLTQIGNSPGSNNSHRDATTIFGLFSNSSGFGQGVGIEISEVDNVADSNFLAPNSQRETASLMVNHPQIGTTSNCFATFMSFLGGVSPFGCTNANNAITYTNPNNPIDMNTVHLFTIEMSLQVNGQSWVAMSIDQNAWMNVTQAACNCIEGSGELYQSLFPYIFNGYAANNIAANPPTPNQSLGTLVNYVLVYNYVPSTLPIGSAPPINPSNNPLNIPPTNNPLFSPFGNINPAGLWQFYATTIGNGVPLNTGNFLINPFFFGGAVLYVITILGILGLLYFTPSADGTRMTHPFMLGMIMFFDTVFNFLMGTLAWWIFASFAIFFMAIMVGTVPSKIGGSDALNV